MTYQILSLDGGGSWALIEVRALIELYGPKTTGHDVLRKFDLVAANSGGSLVLAGLIEDLPLEQISAYFMDDQKRGSIFSPTQDPGDIFVRQTLKIGPKYSTSAKLPAIERLLPRTGISLLAGIADDIRGPCGAPVHILIVGFDYDTNRAVFFRSATAAGEGLGHGEPASVSLAGAVHASTNAPVNYFDKPAALPLSVDRFWDGGVTGNNNPTAVALVEAIVLGNNPMDVHILSLGTAAIQLPLADPNLPGSPFEAQRVDPSLIVDLKKLAGAILDDPPDAATFTAHVVTGGNSGLASPVISRVVRMSPLISPVPAEGGGWMAPGAWSPAQFQHLCQIDMDAMQPSDVTYIDDYCSTWLVDNAPNQPIRACGRDFDPWHPEIGYAKFSEAAKAWEKLSQIPGTPVV